MYNTCTMDISTSTNNNHWLGNPAASGRHDIGHNNPVDHLTLVKELQRIGKGTHRVVADIMPVTGRWVTDPMVVGYGSFSNDVRCIGSNS